MEEATSDRESSEGESERNKPKTHGWIRMHSDEQPKPKPTQVDERLDMDGQSHGRKPRKAPEKP
ncbi:hypothetical protein AUF78_02740 [archaeon 13_1_20CM_2_51_12]|nr:MAG: hypothetical protein AUF78_02740 [archaeon 13_1_20CM_2_51_12]